MTTKKKTKTKKFNPYNVNLDAEEQELLKSYERGELKSIKNIKQGILLAKKIAANTMRKDLRVTFRISSSDLANLKQKAAYKGLPYQTFIASVLHEYAAGHFDAQEK
jgi:predicted DNA binding CopG/RHH family protein